MKFTTILLAGFLFIVAGVGRKICASVIVVVDILTVGLDFTLQ